MPSDYRPTIGFAVAAVRAEKGISRELLAERTGLTQKWLTEVEEGRRDPRWNEVGLIAQVLEVSVFELQTLAETYT